MAQQLSLGVKLPDFSRFDNYYPGPNTEVVTQIRSLAPGEALYLHGANESGRSHLLQAACRELSERGEQAFYLPLKEFVSSDPDMLQGLEIASLVALDDIDQVAGLAQWEEALFHLFNQLREANHCLLVSASDRPEAIGIQLPDLISRLTWGMVYGLKPLSDSDRLAVLQMRARQRGLELPDEVGQFLMARIPRGLTALCASVDQLDEASLVAQRRLTIPFVKSVLAI